MELSASVILDIRAPIVRLLFSSALILHVQTEVHVTKYQVVMSAAVPRDGQGGHVVQVRRLIKILDN